MKKLTFTIGIHASKEKVWDALWQYESFRDWAGYIDPGTYMVGDLALGNEVQFISSENGYGVTSLVDQLVLHEWLVLKHQADTQDTGVHEREKEWTGGTETYRLIEHNDMTTLTVTVDVPFELVEVMDESYPKALERVKVIAEQ